MDDLETVNFIKDTNINDLGKICPKKMSGILIAAKKIVKKTPEIQQGKTCIRDQIKKYKRTLFL